MYKFTYKAEPWFTLGFFMFFLLVIGQIIESVFPGSVLVLFGVCVFFGLGTILCAVYTTTYDKGWNASKIEQEPDEDNSRDSTT